MSIDNEASKEEMVLAIVSKYKEIPGPLLVVLHGIQQELGFIPPEFIPDIAEGLNLSRAEIHGVISFYHFFRSTPAGRHIIQLCRAESCQAMGSISLTAHAEDLLGIQLNKTGEDGEITLEPVYCLGNCACSPAIMIDKRIYGRVNSERFDTLIASIQKKN